jgi:hypothetical protein
MRLGIAGDLPGQLRHGGHQAGIGKHGHPMAPVGLAQGQHVAQVMVAWGESITREDDRQGVGDAERHLLPLLRHVVRNRLRQRHDASLAIRLVRQTKLAWARSINRFSFKTVIEDARENESMQTKNTF